MSENLDYPGFVYACLIWFGGLYAFVKAGSIPSLIMGLSFGFMLAVRSFMSISCLVHAASDLISRYVLDLIHLGISKAQKEFHADIGFIIHAFYSFHVKICFICK